MNKFLLIFGLLLAMGALLAPTAFADGVPSVPGMYYHIDPFAPWPAPQSGGLPPWPFGPHFCGGVVMFSQSGSLFCEVAVLGYEACVGYGGWDDVDRPSGNHLAEFQLDLDMVFPRPDPIPIIFDFTHIGGPVSEHLVQLGCNVDISLAIEYPDVPDISNPLQGFMNLTLEPVGLGMGLSEYDYSPAPPHVDYTIMISPGSWETFSVTLDDWPGEWEHGIYLLIEDIGGTYYLSIVDRPDGGAHGVTGVQLFGEAPNQIPVGATKTIDFKVLDRFQGAPGWELICTKLIGDFTFTRGTISSDGTYTHLWSDIRGEARLTFTADAVGVGLIKVTVTNSDLPPVYYVFDIVPLAPLGLPMNVKTMEPERTEAPAP